MPILCQYGHRVSVLPTGVFSTHTGIEGYVYQSLHEFVDKTLLHWSKLGVGFDIVYSGFLTNIMQIDTLEFILKRFGAINVLDTVMGDCGVLYDMCSCEYVHRYKKLIKYADIITPNITEAAFLCDVSKSQYSLTDVESFVHTLKNMGAKAVVIKSLDIGDGKIGVAINQGANTQYIWHDKIIGNYSGCGDLFASIVVGEIAKGTLLYNACQKASNLTKMAVEFSILQQSSNDANLKKSNQTGDTQSHKKDFGIPFEKLIGWL